MKIRIFSTVENDVYITRIQTEDWSENDRHLMAGYGEPEIDLGGTFVNPYSSTDFTLDSRTVRIMTESPFVQRFDARDYADASVMASIWKDAIVTRIQNAVTALRNNVAVTNVEEIVTL